MNTVFRLDASIREADSVTRAIASTLESTLVEELGGAAVVRREIGLTPLPSTAWARSVFAGQTPAEQRSEEQREAVALAAELAAELQNADAYIFAVPFYNFGVSQHFKTWADLVATDPAFAPGSKTLAGRPASLVVARGGEYGAGGPRDGWDHATGWLNRMLSDIWALDVQLIESELTFADTRDYMAHLREQAAGNLRNAHDQARDHGKRLATRLIGSAAA
jgi:FMN-dependent NADH-azoreductase